MARLIRREGDTVIAYRLDQESPPGPAGPVVYSIEDIISDSPPSRHNWVAGDGDNPLYASRVHLS